MRVMVTGAAGFIGRNLIAGLSARPDLELFGVDRCPVDGGRDAASAMGTAIKVDLATDELDDLILDIAPDRIVHLAAETSVDRSIADAAPFIASNVTGTWNLLEGIRRLLARRPDKARQFRLIHCSTDEVFGESGSSTAFTPMSGYSPRNPYSATKAAADHLVEAWQATYGLRAILLHPSNNYGPWQHPEKLIPGTILRLLQGECVPLYGDGLQTREWLWVGDFCRAVESLLQRPDMSGRFLVGSGTRVSNVNLVRDLCHIVAQRVNVPVQELLQQVAHVDDRPGHDRHYRLDSSLIRSVIGWQPQVELKAGLEATVDWALENRDWLAENRAKPSSFPTREEARR